MFYKYLKSRNTQDISIKYLSGLFSWMIDIKIV